MFKKMNGGKIYGKHRNYDETNEEFAPVSSGKGLKIAGGILAAVGLIYGGYKIVSKIKSKKEKGAILIESTESDECVEEID